VTLRLTALALDSWRELDGFAVSQNMPDLRTLPLFRFASFVYWWATRNAEDATARMKFDSHLWMPPPGEVAQGPWSVEAETSAFAGLKAGLGGRGGVASG
jgi:hypothetical protein